jgi:serine/threonine protein phosphatase PrpC
MRIVSGAATDTGMVREGNEDSYLVDRRLDLFAVADGMGGHRAGEVASAVALGGLREAVDDGISVADAVGRANTAVWDRASDDTELAGMGTTLTAATFDGTTLTIGHVGDSRAYLFRNGAIEQLTVDHSLVAELIRDGRISEEQAAVHPQRSIITRALGVDSSVDVDVYSLVLHPADRVMLCSDGLTSMVRTPRIAEILGAQSDPTAAANALVDAANSAGGEDNITVVVLDAVGEGKDPLPSSVAAAIRPRPAGAAGATGTDATAAVEVVESAPVEVTTETTSMDATPAAPAPAPPLPKDTARYREPKPAHRAGRGVARVALFVLPILVILGIGIAALAYYAHNSYFVTVSNGTVTLYRGRPGGVLWWDPEVVRSTNVKPAQLSAAAQDRIAKAREFTDETNAQQFVQALIADRTEQRTRTASTSTTTTTTPGTSSTTATGSTPTTTP